MSTREQQAPIPASLRAQFQRDSRSVEAILTAAASKGNTCSPSEARQEHYIASRHFELGCWLHHYASRVGQPENFADRVDCIRRCFEAGITRPRYDFFTVFGFGAREFHTCFEMGDGALVAGALKEIAQADPEGLVAQGVRAMGWSSRLPAASAVLTQDVEHVAAYVRSAASGQALPLTEQARQVAVSLAERVHAVHLAERIGSAHGAAEGLERLARELEVPQGHACQFDRHHETTWYLRGPGPSLSAFIRPMPPASAGPTLDAEIRVFLDEPRALLYARHQSGAEGHGEDLLPGHGAYLRAESYAALFTQIRDRIAPVLAGALVAEDALEGPRP